MLKNIFLLQPKQKVQFVTAVVKKKADPAKHKGELMESNIDAMEVCGACHYAVMVLDTLLCCCSVRHMTNVSYKRQLSGLMLL